ncbi:MAG: hypothetical protein H7Y13_17665 [Sphingobacteriaceae bacterium]|nr:hypothetical protein [Sphingobacteriaceae bacterium]
MKPLYTCILFIFSMLLYSCSELSKEYGSLQECYDSVKDLHYNEIVEVWGEPDYKGELSVLPASVNDQNKGIKTYATITCVWNNEKVKITNSKCISINFDVIEIAGGVMYPSSVKSYNIDCSISSNNADYDSSPTYNNQYSNTSVPEKIDTSMQTTTNEEISRDSVPLLARDGEDPFTWSKHLPLTFYSDNEKYTFSRSGTEIRMDAKLLDDENTMKSFTCTLNGNIIALNEGSVFFSFDDNDGALYMNEAEGGHVQLSMKRK